MNKIGLVLRRTRRSEAVLARAWLRVGERHAMHYEWLHNARRRQAESAARTAELARLASRYRTEIKPYRSVEVFATRPGRARRRVGALVGRRPVSGLVLLRDQRVLQTLAHRTMLHWMMLGQAAQAVRDPELLTAATANTAALSTQLSWLTSQLKVMTPQVLCS